MSLIERLRGLWRRHDEKLAKRTLESPPYMKRGERVFAPYVRQAERSEEAREHGEPE